MVTSGLRQLVLHLACAVNRESGRAVSVMGRSTPSLLDGLRMRAVATGGGGELDVRTLFKFHAGRSICDIQELPDGRLRLLEHFEWDLREGAGTNVLEQVTE